MSISMSTTTTTITMTNILPHDVVVDILSRLPVKSVLRFRCVSKPWKIFFSDPSFIKMHLNHSINNNNYEHLMIQGSSICSIAANNSNESSSLAVDDEVVEINDYPLKSYPSLKHRSLFKVGILGSCNGLLLIHSVDKEYFIWNPSTKEFKKLPEAPPIKSSKDGFHRCFIEYGFGYDEITEDYKVVKIILFDTDVDELRSVVYSEVMVYSLRSNCWRKSQDPPYKLANGFAGRLVNGALHWIAEQPNSEEENESYTIVSFNLGDEKYRVIEQPNDDAEGNKFDMSLNVLGGCLCIIRDFRRIRSDIWVMKDYGVKESWTKLFNISQPNVVIEPFYCLRPIKFTKNGEVVFQKDSSSLFVYDPKHGTAKTLQIRGLKAEFETYTYVESLISLNSGTFVGKDHLTLEETRELETKLYNWEWRVIGR